MSGADVEVKGLFATPVAAVMLPGADERNAELTEIILRRRAEQSSIGASSIGGWHSTRDIAEWGGKGIRAGAERRPICRDPDDRRPRRQPDQA